MSTTLRIVTWNVWHRFGPWEERQAAIEAVLRQVDADVVCLQEAFEERGGRSQPAELAAALGLVEHRSYARSWNGDLGFGNAILSRWPVERWQGRPLPPHPRHEEWRGVLGASLRTPAGRLDVFTTHLNYRLAQSAVRQHQVRSIAAFVGAWARGRRLPAVLTGDFNAEPTSDEMRMLTGRADLGVEGMVFVDAWEKGGDGGPGATWTAANPFAASPEPDRRIDYVLVEPGFSPPARVTDCRRIGHGPVEGVWPSDHLGVVAELTVPD